MTFSSIILGSLVSLYGQIKDSYEKSYLKWLLGMIFKKISGILDSSVILQGISSTMKNHGNDSENSLFWGKVGKLLDSLKSFLQKRIENSFFISRAIDIGADTYLLIFTMVFLPVIPTSIVIVLSLSIITIVKSKLIVNGSRFRYSKIYLLFYSLFMVSMFLGVFFNIDLKSGIQSFIMNISCVYLGLMVPYILDSRRKVKILLNGIAFTLLMVSIHGIYQKIFGAPMDPAWMDQKYGLDTVRIYSVFENPNVYGEYLILTIPMVFALFSTALDSKLKVIYLGITALGTLNLFLTLSRASMIGLAIAIAIIVVLIARQYLPAMLILLAISPFILPDYIIERVMSIFGSGPATTSASSVGAGVTESSSGVDTSIAYRGSIYGSSLKMVKDHFLTGVGLGQFREVYKSYSVAKSFHAHNTFLMIIIEGGILAILSFAAMGLTWSKKMVSRISNRKDLMSFMSVSALGAIAGCSAQGLADHIWHNYSVMFMYFMVIGIGYATFYLAGDISGE